MGQYQLINSLLGEAASKGVAVGVPVYITLLGSTNERAATVAPSIKICVSYEEPAPRSGLWLNPASKQLRFYENASWTLFEFTTIGNLFKQDFTVHTGT